MTQCLRAFVGALAAVVAIGTGTLQADTVQLTLRDGRISLVATNATPAQIFEAWSRAGGVLVVNADRIPSTPVTLTLEDVPEEQALDTLLRPVSGYLALRRTNSPAAQSIFDRIVILATPQVARPAASSQAATPAARGGPAPVFPQPNRPAVAQQQATQQSTQPQGIPQAPGVTRLVGPDGQPVEDDQVGAPPYNGGDVPPPAAPRPFVPPPQQPPQQQQPPQSPPTAAPAGVPVPGMVVPTPQRSPGQAPTPGH